MQPALSVTDVKFMAQTAADSRLFKGIDTPEAAFTLMMLCQAEGLHPIQALRRYDIIDGKPALKTDAMLAEFQGRGGSVTWNEHSHEVVDATFTAPGLGKPVTVRWTLEDAKRAGLAGKPTWGKYPRQMLRARVVSEGVRMAMPGVVIGLYTPEEVQDFDDRPVVAQPVAPVQATTAPAEMATPGSVRALAIALTAAGVKSREDKLTWISGMLGRRVESSKETTEAECQTLIVRAKNGEAPPPQPETPTAEPPPEPPKVDEERPMVTKSSHGHDRAEAAGEIGRVPGSDDE
jgi:hypothetical protein